MIQLKPTKDISIVQKIIEKPVLTQQDCFLMNTYVTSSLADFCGDIRQNEIDKVHEVEDESILTFLNVTMSVFGRYNQDAFRKLLSTYPFNIMIQEISSFSSQAERNRAYIRGITKMILSNGNTSLKVKAVGQMPQKMFSFRQMTADDWFANFVNLALERIVHVYEKLGEKSITSSLFAICAYQLYHSQPNRFNINSCEDEDSALKTIIRTFLESKNGVGTRVYSEEGELLSKSL